MSKQDTSARRPSTIEISHADRDAKRIEQFYSLGGFKKPKNKRDRNAIAQKFASRKKRTADDRLESDGR